MTLLWDLTEDLEKEDMWKGGEKRGMFKELK